MNLDNKLMYWFMFVQKVILNIAIIHVITQSGSTVLGIRAKTFWALFLGVMLALNIIYWIVLTALMP